MAEVILTDAKFAVRSMVDDIDNRVQNITDSISLADTKVNRVAELFGKYIDLNQEQITTIEEAINKDRDNQKRLIDLCISLDEQLDLRSQKQKKLNIFFGITIGILFMTIIALIAIILI